MKIQCQSCQAKYTIADEKVLGKVVKIRCKKCSSTIVVDGNELARGADEGGATQVFDYSGASTEQWTVNVADGDQRTMSPQEIAVEYRNGTINDETYCWKEDMPDWLPLREIEALYALVGGGHAAPPPSLHEEAPLQAQAQAEEAPAPLFGGQEPAGSPFAGYTNGNGHGSSAGAGAGGGLFGGAEEAAYAAPSPSAARRGGRGQGADLFGNVERAGGEEDVMTSAQAAAGGSLDIDGDKLTGQRNENSVLFSLSALTETKKNEPASNRTTATGEGSGLIDIRALSQSMGSSDDKKDSRGRVDDIMNLSGGGAFGAALAAPILAPPPMDLATSPAAQEGKSNKTLLIGLIGGGALIAAAIVAVALITTGGSSNDKGEAKDTTEAPSAVAANNELAAKTPEPPPAAPVEQPNVAAAAPAPTVDDTPPPPGVGQATGSAKPAAAAAAKPAAAKSEPRAATDSTPAKAPDPPPKQESPKDFGAALAAAAGKPANEAPKESNSGGSTAPFDRGAAAAALSGVNVQSCKKPGGPTGAGHVKVTFAPNGTVSTAIVDDTQYPGTPVGGCVAGKFRGARIPAFSGSSVTVGKGFTIN